MKPTTYITLAGQDIMWSNTIKYLGLTIDKGLRCNVLFWLKRIKAQAAVAKLVTAETKQQREQQQATTIQNHRKVNHSR